MLESLSPKAKTAYLMGSKAESSGLSMQSCPYGMADMLERNAWLAGHHDRSAGCAVESQDELIVKASRKYVEQREIDRKNANFVGSNALYNTLLRAVRAGG